MTKVGLYERGMSLPRLYVSRKQQGHGVPSVRDVYGFELLSAITYFKWTEDTNTEIIIEKDKKHVESMRKRKMKVL